VTRQNVIRAIKEQTGIYDDAKLLTYLQIEIGRVSDLCALLDEVADCDLVPSWNEILRRG